MEYDSSLLRHTAWLSSPPHISRCVVQGLRCRPLCVVLPLQAASDRAGAHLHSLLAIRGVPVVIEPRACQLHCVNLRNKHRETLTRYRWKGTCAAMSQTLMDRHGQFLELDRQGMNGGMK